MKILSPIVVVLLLLSCRASAERPATVSEKERASAPSPSASVAEPLPTPTPAPQERPSTTIEPSEETLADLVNLVTSKRKVEALKGSQAEQQLKSLGTPRFVEKTSMQWVFEGSAADRGIREAKFIFDPGTESGVLVSATFSLSTRDATALEANLEKKLRAKLRRPPLWKRAQASGTAKGWDLNEDWQIVLNGKPEHVELVVAIRND